MSSRYLADCKMALVRSGLLKALPKSSLRVLLVYFTIAKWRTGVFEIGYKATSTISGLDTRDVKAGVKELLKLGIIEQLHKGKSSADRSVFKFSLERIENYGFSQSNEIQDAPRLKLWGLGGDVKKPSECHTKIK